MGWFDPPHVKMLAKSPELFQQGFMFIGPMIEAFMISDPRTLRGSGVHFRATVVGRIALAVYESDPRVWSHDAIQYIQRQLRVSEHWLGPEMAHVARSVAVELAYGKNGPPENRS